MRRRLPDWHSLPTQMILSFVALVLLTAAAAGLPSHFLMRNQLQRQAREQVRQGVLATQALYAATQGELENMAMLTAQRPTLRELMANGRQDELQPYLETLRPGLGLDLILVCTGQGRLVAGAGAAPPADLCASRVTPGFQAFAAGSAPRSWLMATAEVVDESRRQMGSVWVGVELDGEFLARLRAQTGLEQTLLVDGQPVASSLASRVTAANRGGEPARLRVDGQDFYTDSFSLGAGDLRAEVALDVAGLGVAQAELGGVLAASIIGAVAVALLLGTYLARRISSPLARLAQVAGAMGQGSTAGGLATALEAPMVVDTRVREVAQVAQALEAARHDLQRSVTQLQQEKRWIDHLLESIVEGIVTLDRHGYITFFSHGAERITGWSRDEVLGRPCDTIFRPLEAQESFSKLIPPPGQRRKISIELSDGRQAILAVTGARLMPPERGDALVALVFRDISEEEAVHRLLGDFLANVAHEFRTPLSALAASVELLLDQAPDLSPGELEELLVTLHLGVLGLQTLIDNLLESASIETGHFRVHPHPCRVATVIAEAVELMQPLLLKHGQRLVVELPAAMPIVQADPRRTVQVLNNLLSNAIKYGPDDDEIEVCAAVEGNWVRLSVADRGPGIRAEGRADLFRRFVHPAHDDSRAQVGAGLGLSVVKAIVEAHGGQVGIEGRPGGGSVFWFTLPRAEAA
jgi:PAS domain S-box-containing protein